MGAEAIVVSCARSVTHLRDAFPRVLVVSSAPAADAANLLRPPASGTPLVNTIGDNWGTSFGSFTQMLGSAASHPPDV